MTWWSCWAPAACVSGGTAPVSPAAAPGTAACCPCKIQPVRLVGCAVFATFFIRFEANLSEYGSYKFHIRMFWYIRQHYSHHWLLICFKIFVCWSEYSNHSEYSLSHFLIMVNIRFKIFVLKQIFAKPQANFTFKWIFAYIYSHKSENPFAYSRMFTT